MPHPTVPYVLAAPGYLAGGGDWEHLTEWLLRGHGWRNVSTIDQHTALASPDGRLQVALDRRAAWTWTLRATTPAGREWAALLGAHLPVEYVTALVDTMRRPASRHRPDVLGPLHAAGWNAEAAAPAPTAVSPDGLVPSQRRPHSAPRAGRGTPPACSTGTAGGQPSSAPTPRPASSPRSPKASPPTTRCRAWPSAHRCTDAGPTPVSARPPSATTTNRRRSKHGSPTPVATASPGYRPPHRRLPPAEHVSPAPADRTLQELSVPLAPGTPPPITAERPPRLAVFLFRRYLRAFARSPRGRANPPATGRPEAALDDSRRLGHHS